MWRTWRKLPHKLEEIPKQELNGTLKRFLAEVRKSDGSEYEPDSLRTMLAALDRHLRQAGANFSIIKDREFDECRKTLNGRAIVLREGGKQMFLPWKRKSNLGQKTCLEEITR